MRWIHCIVQRIGEKENLNDMSDQPRLRPMSVSDMLDAAFRLYRSHFFTFVGIVALIYVPLTILQGASQFLLGMRALGNFMSYIERAPFGDTSLPIGDLIAYAAISVVVGLLQGMGINIISGALANAISKIYLGQTPSILEAYRLGGQRIISLMLLSILAALVTLLVVAPFVGIFVLFLSTLGVRPGEDPNVGLILLAMFAFLGGIIVIIILGCYVVVRLLLVTQVIVLEDTGLFGALRRSWNLVKGAFWRVLGVLVLMSVLAQIIQIVVSLPFSMLSSAINAMSQDPTTIVRNSIISSLISQLGLIIILPLSLSVYTLLYYDLRIRKEGFDMELIAQQPMPYGGENPA